MITMDSFLNIEKIGELKMDKIFFESYYPILFTCLNEDNDVFLCVCCQADLNIKKWLITNVTPGTIVDFLSNRITIRDSFLRDKGLKYTVIFNNKTREFQIEEDNIKDWEKEENIDLPTAGEYIDAEEDEFIEEINYFKNMEICYLDCVKQEVVKNITEKISFEENNYILKEYNSTSFGIAYTIGSIKELESHQYFKVMFDIIKDKTIIENLEETIVKYEKYIQVEKVTENKMNINLGREEDICINNVTARIANAA